MLLQPSPKKKVTGCLVRTSGLPLMQTTMTHQSPREVDIQPFTSNNGKVWRSAILIDNYVFNILPSSMTGLISSLSIVRYLSEFTVLRRMKVPTILSEVMPLPWADYECFQSYYKDLPQLCSGCCDGSQSHQCGIPLHHSSGYFHGDSPSGKGGEACEGVRKRMIDVCCLQEVRWRGQGAGMLGIEVRSYNCSCL